MNSKVNNIHKSRIAFKVINSNENFEISNSPKCDLKRTELGAKVRPIKCSHKFANPKQSKSPKHFGWLSAFETDKTGQIPVGSCQATTISFDDLLSCVEFEGRLTDKWGR